MVFQIDPERVSNAADIAKEHAKRHRKKQRKYEKLKRDGENIYVEPFTKEKIAIDDLIDAEKKQAEELEENEATIREILNKGAQKK